jgi:hypothetical protein
MASRIRDAVGGASLQIDGKVDGFYCIGNLTLDSPRRNVRHWNQSFFS